MKVVDFEKKGNVVRFYLGADGCKNYWGDDWDDAPYEHNAGTVYDEYVQGYKDIAFPFDSVVMQPCDGHYNSEWSKEDMKQRRIPCICVLDSEYQDRNVWYCKFEDISNHSNAKRFYFGDKMEPDELSFSYKEKVKTEVQEYLDKNYEGK